VPPQAEAGSPARGILLALAGSGAFWLVVAVLL
jgi:hypothetical protein